MAKTKARLEGELREAQRQVLERDEEVARLLRKHSAASTAVSQLKGVIDTLKGSAAREAGALAAVNKDLKHQLRQAESAVTDLKARLADEVHRPPPPCTRCPELERRIAA